MVQYQRRGSRFGSVVPGSRRHLPHLSQHTQTSSAVDLPCECVCACRRHGRSESRTGKRDPPGQLAILRTTHRASGALLRLTVALVRVFREGALHRSRTRRHAAPLRALHFRCTRTKVREEVSAQRREAQRSRTPSRASVGGHAAHRDAPGTKSQVGLGAKRDDLVTTAASWVGELDVREESKNRSCLLLYDNSVHYHHKNVERIVRRAGGNMPWSLPSMAPWT